MSPSALLIHTRGCLRLFALFLIASLGLLTTCGDGADSSTGPGDDDSAEITTLQSSKARASAAAIDAADVDALVSSNTQFAFGLYESLRAESDGNLFYSPYSISLALAMTWAGARGETDGQMADVLRFSLPSERLHPAFNALEQELVSRGRNLPRDEDGTGFQLSIANSIWGQREFDFEDSFLDLLAEQYGAVMRLVDFIGSPDPSRLLINDWVAQRTEDRIKDLLPEGSVNVLTRLVLTNAIYFNASWLDPFDPVQTVDGAFSKLDGSSVTTPMMNHSVRTVYAEGQGYQAVELPYVGYEVSMVVILPEAGDFGAFESDLDRDTLEGVMRDLSDTQVTLTMPRFEFEADVGLSEVLKGLGMPIAFEPPGADSGADFSGMDGRRDLFIHDVLHKAFVAVDEEGTEAAAATAVIVGVRSLPPSATMVIDRPFIFLIRDRATGTVLFLGRVVDPTS